MEHVNGFKAVITAGVAALTALWGWFGWFVLAWVLCMILDYATGSAAAMKDGKWSSKAARDGIWHKVGAIVAVCIAGILDMVIGLMVNNIPAVELPFTYSVLVCPLVVAWYTLTELGSIAENAGKLGAPVPGFLRRAIEMLKSGVDIAGEKMDGKKMDGKKMDGKKMDGKKE